MKIIMCFITFGILIFLNAFNVTAQETIYPLSFKQATQLAIDNNFDIQLAKYEHLIKATDELKAKSIYDTILEGEIAYQNNQRKQSSTILGTKTVQNDYNVGLSQKLPTGTTIDLDLENNRNSTNSVFSTTPLVHDSTLGVTVFQELGKNFFGLADRGQVKLTLLEIENTKYLSLEKIESAIGSVQKAYWDLVLEMERSNIQQDMVEQAKRLYDLHQEKLEDGLMEIPEAIASEANYKRRKNELQLIRNQVHFKSNTLKLLLNIEDNTKQLKATDSFSMSTHEEFQDVSLKKAFEQRRDYKRIENNIKSKDILVSIKKNQIWPEINLTASLERNGLGDHFKQALTQITEEDNPNFSAGLEFSFPLNNREARGALKGAQLEKARELINFKLLERQIAIAIIDRVRNTHVFYESAKNTEEISLLQARKLKEEEKKFQAGRSDVDTIIRFQEDLIEARADEMVAKYRYFTSLIDLRQEEGSLLTQYWKEGL